MGRPRKDQETAAAQYEVIVPFQDAREYAGSSEPKQYEVGDDVSHFDAERLQLSIQRGLVRDNNAEATEETEA